MGNWCTLSTRATSPYASTYLRLPITCTLITNYAGHFDTQRKASGLVGVYIVYAIEVNQSEFTLVYVFNNII